MASSLPFPLVKRDLDGMDIDQIHASLPGGTIDLMNGVPSNFDDSSFPLAARLALTRAFSGHYLIPSDHLMHGESNASAEREWALLPMPTGPLGMGLPSSGFPSRVYRSPESIAIESGCIDPALLMSADDLIPNTNYASVFNAPAPLKSSFQCDYSMFEDDDTADEDYHILGEDDHTFTDEERTTTDEDDGDDSADSDYENPSAWKKRQTRPLPRRAAGASSSTSVTSRASRRHLASSASNPSAAPSSSLTAAPVKRKIAQFLGPRATKKAAVVSSTAPSPSHVVSCAVPFADDNAAEPSAVRAVPAPRSSVPDDFPARYQHLVDLGCTVEGRGMTCHQPGCFQRTGTFADMSRHMLTHFPDRKWCPGCPMSFARNDSLKRHCLDSARAGHTSAERKAFLRTFMQRADVAQLRRDCPNTTRGYSHLNETLELLFNKLFAQHQGK
ncbi:hypothetical protein GGX14DRAFT_676112 [Mycena pura]|uniref:C2H2-type domain-containing protein n=1 Tax=Mycena pura TaxID=153505 RepID=A0AAD6YGX6_9AGAR|nr:hypothetical protein GGX14DRAFT_676112 [Mycena pura]